MTRNFPPDDVDRWLTDFFRAELPNPFPPAPAVAEPARPRRAAEHGRLTLAASVAALLGLGAYLSYGPMADPAPTGGAGLVEKGTANGTGTELDKAMKRIAPK